MTERSFLAELKRRNVIRMAGLYLVGGWLVTQVAGTLLPMFGAPDWLARSIVVLLAIGFLPVLVFSWIYEITPEGIKRESEVARDESITPDTGRRIDRAIRQRHLEFDPGELLGRLAELAQQRQPARIVVDPVEQRIQRQVEQVRVPVRDGLLQPLEGAVALPAERVHGRDEERAVLLVPRDQVGQRGVGVGLAPERVEGHRQADHLPGFARLLFDLRQRTRRIAL